tara:strand:- start:6715 stop:7527 length:813 start_codon:yes stop_codon:yes gene_type:complete
VFNTRPDAQAEKWRQALQAAGAEVLRLPLMVIEPVTEAAAEQAIKDRILSLADYQHAIFVSQNAAFFGLQWLDQYWPQLPYRTRFYAVGSATAARLTDYGCQVIEPGNTMNSEALLALPSLQSLTHEKIMIFRGCGGRPLLADQLRERGAQVDYCELYHRVFPRAEALERLMSPSTVDLSHSEGKVIALHSGEALQNWNQLLQDFVQAQEMNNNQQQLPYNLEHLRGISLVVPGQRVAQLAQGLGFTRILIAENASDQAMLQALQAYIKN